MSLSPAQEFQVRCIRHEADDIISLELAPYDGSLPDFTPGSHIDLHLGNGLIRSYSLTNGPADRSCYQIGVFRDPASTGGSAYIHDRLRVGQLMQIGAPRNNFPLESDASHSVFIAGGIGVTPFLAMAAALNEQGKLWTLYYSARNRARAAFLSTAEELAAMGNGRLVCHFDDDADGALLDLAKIMRSAPPEAHFYCCGPAGMLSAYRNACAEIPGERVHFEYFSADTQLATDGGFDVVLAKSGKRINVPAGNTILDALAAGGVSVPYSCQQGVCGACEVKVLSGTPDHRDMILTDAERASNEIILICCSGSLSEELVLDL